MLPRHAMLLATTVMFAASVSAYSQVPIPAAPPPISTVSAATPQLAAGSAMDAPDGMRITKIVGAVVYDDQDTKIGTVDDLIVRLDQKVSVAILSVGGFLGVGSKLVAVPYNDMRINAGKVILPAATKESLKALPDFNYATQ